MFEKFNRKFKLSIMCLIFCTMIIHYLFIVVSYTSVLNNDFNSKVRDFNNQYMANTETKIKSVENQTQLFIKKYFTAEVLSKYDAYMNSTLTKLKSYSADIRGAFICGKNTQSYYTSAHYSAVMLSKEAKDVLLDDETGWKYLNKHLSEGMLLYSVALNDDEARLFIEVNPMIFQTWDKENMFYEDVETAVSFNEECGKLQIEKNDIIYYENNNSDNQKDNKEKLVLKNTLSGTGITVETEVSQKQLKRQLFKCRIITGMIFAVFLLIAYIATHIFSKKIDTFLISLCEKMQMFAKEPETYGKEDFK